MTDIDTTIKIEAMRMAIDIFRIQVNAKDSPNNIYEVANSIVGWIKDDVKTVKAKQPD